VESDVVRPREDVVQFYSRVGRLFEAWGRLVDARARARVRALCAVTDTEAVLEVGIGAGSQLAALASANRSGRTVGVDLADGMLRETRQSSCVRMPASFRSPMTSSMSSPAHTSSTSCRGTTFAAPSPSFVGSFDPEGDSCSATGHPVSADGTASAIISMAVVCR